MRSAAIARRMESMKTTIDLKDEHRERLLEIAAQRGDGGLSQVVGEAIEIYLAHVPGKETLRSALAARGALSDHEAGQLRAATGEIRSSWR